MTRHGAQLRRARPGSPRATSGRARAAVTGAVVRVERRRAPCTTRQSTRDADRSSWPWRSAFPGPRAARSGSTSPRPSARSTTATLTVSECGKRVAGPWRARVGRNGALGPPPRGRRHDAGRHVRLRPGRLRARPRSGRALALPPARLRRLVGRGPALRRRTTGSATSRCGTQPPFGGGSEALWRDRRVAYRLFAVRRVQRRARSCPGRGSAIFLHVDTGRATNGCVSLPHAAARLRCCGGCGPARRSRSPRIDLCIILSYLYSSQHEARGAILGCAGYSGQETLDRVLAHPGSSWSRSARTRSPASRAAALDPRLDGSLPAFMPNARGGRERRRRPLPLPRQRRGRRLRAAAPTRSSSTSPGAHRLADERLARGVVRHRARRVELRAARALSRRRGR